MDNKTDVDRVSRLNRVDEHMRILEKEASMQVRRDARESRVLRKESDNKLKAKFSIE